MMGASKPNSTNFGNSFAGKVFGTDITDSTVKGDIITSALNVGLMADVVEFNTFEETVKDYVLARLGAPVVRVELTPFQLKTCMDEATTRLSYHASYWTDQLACFNASAGQNLYELPRYMIDNLEYVVYKKSLLSMQYQSGTLEFDFFIKYFQDNFLFANFAVSDFAVMMTYLKMIRKQLSQEGSWDVVNNQYLLLYPTPVTTPDPVIVQYRALDSGTIHPAYRNWIQKYSLACAKGVLGEIRGKYQSLPSPGGGAVLNGRDLVIAAENEKEKLYQELISEIEEPPYFSAY